MAEIQGRGPGLGVLAGGPGVNLPGPKLPHMTPAQTVKPKLGWVHFWSFAPFIYLNCRYGPESAKVVDGFGGWEVVPIPEREAITQWKGKNTLAVSLTLLIESPDRASGVNIEHEIAQMEALAGIDTDDEPPLFSWSGNGPHDYSENPDIEWFVEAFEDVGSERNGYGNRIRQSYSITIRAYNPGEYLKRAKNKKPKKRSKNAKTKNYRVTRRDVKDGLRGIAKRELGDANRWKAISKLNKIRDPHNIKAGQIIKLPVTRKVKGVKKK